MKLSCKIILLLWFLNILLVSLIFIYIIFPNFYFGFTAEHYIIMITSSSIVSLITITIFIKTMKVEAVLPLILPIMFYLLLYLANII